MLIYITACHFRWHCAIFADTGVFKIRITILKSMQYVAFLWDFSQITSNHQSNTKNIFRNMIFLNMKLIKFHGIPWNSMELQKKLNQKFHGIPWNSGVWKKFYGIPWNFGSGQNSMEFHGTTGVVQMLLKKFHGTLEKVPLNFLTK